MKLINAKLIAMKSAVMKRRAEKFKKAKTSIPSSTYISILTGMVSFVITRQHKGRYEWYFNRCIEDQYQNYPIPTDFKKTIVQDNSVPHLIGNLIFVALVL